MATSFLRHLNAIVICFVLISTKLQADPPTTWMELPRPSETAAPNAIDFGNGVFVAVGNSGMVISSPDGITWTKQSSGISADLLRLKFVNGSFFAMNHADNTLKSPDGVNWQPIVPLYDVTFANNYYYGIIWTNISGVRAGLVRSTDLTAWETVTVLPGGGRRIEYVNGVLLFPTDQVTGQVTL